MSKSFECKDCGKSVRFKAVTPFLVIRGKCPQCFTKEVNRDEAVQGEDQEQENIDNSVVIKVDKNRSDNTGDTIVSMDLNNGEFILDL